MSDQEKELEPIAQIRSQCERKEATPVEVLELFVEELAQEFRRQWKEELGEELRESEERLHNRGIRSK